MFVEVLFILKKSFYSETHLRQPDKYFAHPQMQTQALANWGNVESYRSTSEMK